VLLTISNLRTRFNYRPTHKTKQNNCVPVWKRPTFQVPNVDGRWPIHKCREQVWTSHKHGRP